MKRRTDDSNQHSGRPDSSDQLHQDTAAAAAAATGDTRWNNLINATCSTAPVNFAFVEQQRSSSCSSFAVMTEIPVYRPIVIEKFNSVLNFPQSIASLYNSWDFDGLRKLLETHADMSCFRTKFAEWNLEMDGYEALLAYCNCLVVSKPDSLMLFEKTKNLKNMVEARLDYSFTDSVYLHDCISKSNVNKDIIVGNITSNRIDRLFKKCDMTSKNCDLKEMFRLVNTNEDLIVKGAIIMKLIVQSDTRKITEFTIDSKIFTIKVKSKNT